MRRTNEPAATSRPSDPSLPTHTPIMYLPPENWSPRYDHTFFTASVTAATLMRRSGGSTDPLPTTIPSAIHGKTNLPAYYYHITIQQQHQTRVVLRRYSHFKWWYEQVRDLNTHRPPPTTSGSAATASSSVLWSAESSGELPPAYHFHWQTATFAKLRQEQLSQFVNNLLSRPGYANHPATLIFLEFVT